MGSGERRETRCGFAMDLFHVALQGGSNRCGKLGCGEDLDAREGLIHA